MVTPSSFMSEPTVIPASIRSAALAGAPAAQPAPAARSIIEIDDVDFCYGATQALHDITLAIEERKVTAFIGPSGCGKSTLLRCLNRMNDLIDGARITTGQIRVDGVDISDSRVDVIELRKRVGMVFQKSNPFPKSIYENITYGLRIQGVKNKPRLDEVVERSLRGAALWDEVKDRLHQSALGLSGGQQQRLCIARALASSPEIILFDEPTSALDPVATLKIEELILGLAQRTTIVIVTHNMHQAARVSDYTAFMYLGELVEFDRTSTIFQRPSNDMTQKYVTGHFG